MGKITLSLILACGLSWAQYSPPSGGGSPGGSASGDLTGTYPSPAVAKINGTSPASVATSGSASDLGTGTLPNGRLVSIPNSSLANPSTTVNGTSCVLGSTCAPTATPTLGNVVTVNGTACTLGSPCTITATPTLGNVVTVNGTTCTLGSPCTITATPTLGNVVTVNGTTCTLGSSCSPTATPTLGNVVTVNGTSCTLGSTCTVTATPTLGNVVTVNGTTCTLGSSCSPTATPTLGNTTTVNGTACTLGSTCSPSATVTPIFSQVTTVSNAGSSTNVTLVSTTNALGSPTLTAGYFGTVGTVLHVFASGTYATAASPGTINMKIRFGTTTVCSGSGTVTASESTDMWVVNAYLTVRTTGGSGTIMCNSVGMFDNALSSIPTSIPFSNSGNTFDTTSALVFDFVEQWNSFASGDTISMTNLVLSQL